MRPAILTSTVWALAWATPPVLPHRVIVVTTTRGRDRLRDGLFATPSDGGACIWEALRASLRSRGHDLTGRLRFGDTGEDIRVFTAPDGDGRSRELDDLRTAADYEHAADLLLEIVRGVTAIANSRLVASVSGGRNPLVSLLAGALGFLGRAQDRLVHAMIGEPFDTQGLAPPFHFPQTPPIEHRYFDPARRCERTISSAAAHLELVEIPFVRLRRLFVAEPQLYRSRYSALARAYSDKIVELTGPVEIAFDDRHGVATVFGRPIQLRGREHPFFAFLFERWQHGEPPFAGHDRALGPLIAFLGPWQTRHPDFNLERKDKHWRDQCSLLDLPKLLNALRNRVSDAGLESAADRLFPRKGPLGLPLPPETAPARP